MLMITYVQAIAIVSFAAAVVWLWARRRAASLAAQIPVAEIKDSVVLNVDGSMAVGFELSPVEYTASSSSALEALAQNLSALVRRLPDGAALQLIVDLDQKHPQAVKSFLRERVERKSASAAADTLGRDVARHFEKIAFRSTRIFLFVCLPYEFQAAAVVRAGILPKDRPRWTPEKFGNTCKKLEQLASTVTEHLASLGLRTTLASDAVLLDLVQSHLNPDRPMPRPGTGAGADVKHQQSLPDDLNPVLTLRERLASTSFSMPTPRTLKIGDNTVRAISINALPDATYPGLFAPLFFEMDGPARVSISVERLPSESTLASLKVRRSMAQGVASMSLSRNIDAEVQSAEIESVMHALSQSSACLCAVQVTCAVRGRDPNEVDARVLRLEEMLARAGGVTTLVEDHAHSDVYFAMMPGASHRFRRTRTVLDANAADLIMPFGSWRGSKQGPLMLRTRAGDPLLFNPFDQALPSYNGFIVGPMGSGKSFFTNLLLANHVAAGGAAVIIDIGGSYRRLTGLFDGTYIDIGKADTVGLNPLPSVSELIALPETKRDEKLQFLAGFLELLLSERGAMPTSERALVTKALAAFYSESNARHRLDAQPTLEDLQRFIVEYSGDGLDKEGALRLARRLDLWTQGPRARLFSKPADLSIAPSLISIDLKAIESDRELQAVALYVLAFIIWSKVAEDKRDTLVIIDECWALLDNPAAVRLIESLVRTSRKYGAALWCITQRAEDLLGSAVGKILVDCAFQRIFLQHAAQHREIAQAFRLTDHELAAFESLTQAKGRYSEAFLQVQHHSEVVQVIPSPIAYWMATTNARDKHVEASLKERNPGVAPIKLLEALANRLPHGAPV
jgi:type IV secretory pathway VirB4 component